MRGSFFSLHWRDIDPATHSCDLSLVREVAKRHVQKLSESLSKHRDHLLADPRQTACEHDITLELVARYGLWIAGRTWKPLTWSVLCDAQMRVLGQQKIDFRAEDAFAKGGRERYGLNPKTRKEFEMCLAEANDSSLSPQARAARVYLDICFFHPFVDGNARAARLALDHILTGARLSLAIADPLFLFALHARDPEVAWRFHHEVCALAGRMKTT